MSETMAADLDQMSFKMMMRRRQEAIQMAEVKLREGSTLTHCAQAIIGGHGATA